MERRKEFDMTYWAYLMIRFVNTFCCCLKSCCMRIQCCSVQARRLQKFQIARERLVEEKDLHKLVQQNRVSRFIHKMLL